MLRLFAIVVTALAAGAAPANARPPRPAERPTEAIRRAAEAFERKAAREPEPSPARDTQGASEVLHLDLSQVERPMCHVQAYSRVVKRLLGLSNTSEVMSLEVWGDAVDYGPYQKVLFHVRVPRAAYVTLYWIGPEGWLTVPMDNVHVPADRDVVVDTGGIIVPPYGRERWVAIATLEPLPLGCGDERTMLGYIERRLGLVHGIGRWEVESLEAVMPRRTRP